MTQLIFLVGPRGCGKTTIGHALAEARGFQFADTDHELQEHEQRSVATIVQQEGWERFRALETQALESQVSQLQAAKPSSGGFLSGLFGGGQSRGSDPIPGAEQYGRPQASVQPQYAPQAQQQNYAPQASRSGGGFMAGALQTAAGVAGGVVLGNMLTNMFSGSHPQEIVNIIEEKPQPDLSQAQDNSVVDDTFRQDDSQFLADNNDYDADFDAGFGNDDFGSDDDSWV